MRKSSRESSADIAALLAGHGTDLGIVDRALEELGSGAPEDVSNAATRVLCAIASKRAGRELLSLDDVAGWLLGVPNGATLGRLVLSASGGDDQRLGATVKLLVSRRLLHPGDAPAAITFEDAAVQALDQYLIEEWKRSRARSNHDWLYHPRRTGISSLVVRKFLADLITASRKLRLDAEHGRVACDLNVAFAAGGRNKTLDCVLGKPLEALEDSVEPEHPLRKARLDQPLITLEVKACMTSHRQANSRLIDELHSSVEVAKAQSRAVIPVAIVIVNVSPTFTNPLNLPGPNKHVPHEVARIFERVVDRVPLDRGSGLDNAYGGLALVVVDTDNEKRIREAPREGRVPPSHTYERAVGRVAALYDRLTTAP